MNRDRYETFEKSPFFRISLVTILTNVETREEGFREEKGIQRANPTEIG